MNRRRTLRRNTAFQTTAASLQARNSSACRGLGSDFIAFQTEETGEDNDKPALLRQSYILSQTAITSGREVSYDEGETWFERNELDIERK